MKARRRPPDRSFGLRLATFLRELPEEETTGVLHRYAALRGHGAAAYLRRSLARAGGAVSRPEEVLADVWPDLGTRLAPAEQAELLTLLRISRIRATARVEITLGPEAFEEALRRVEATVGPELEALFPATERPPDPEAARLLDALRDSERVSLTARERDFRTMLGTCLGLRRRLPPSARLNVAWDSATLHLEVRMRGDAMTEKTEAEEPSEERLLAQWSDLELESRFKSGEVSYPEYVLRNMDQFFSEEERSELHKIAATHGLELERQLMEIQIKSRTSEADVKKLVDTIRTLKEKGVRADVVSRHETPSGHIEIVARTSPWRLGCFPWIISGLAFVLSLIVLLA